MPLRIIPDVLQNWPFWISTSAIPISLFQRAFDVTFLDQKAKQMNCQETQIIIPLFLRIVPRLQLGQKSRTTTISVLIIDILPMDLIITLFSNRSFPLRGVHQKLIHLCVQKATIKSLTMISYLSLNQFTRRRIQENCINVLQQKKRIIYIK